MADAGPLIRKLENFAPLRGDDKRALDALAVREVKCYDAREDVIHDGDRPGHVHVVLDGFACRYKTLEDGRRQITAYFVPGDFCDLHVFVLRAMDHSIGALTPCTVSLVPREAVLDLLARPALARALWWATLVDEAVLREWVVNLGRRDARERVGHVLCELHMRLRAVGLADGDACELPLTQTELADTLGLSTAHINRTLQQLRAEGLIELRGKRLTILDAARLRETALFDPNYLHLDREGGGRNARGDAGRRG